MPVLSVFYGIVIRMYFCDDKQHHRPHVHAEYAGQQAVFGIGNGGVLAGGLPSGKVRLVQAWKVGHESPSQAGTPAGKLPSDVTHLATCRSD